MKRILVAFALMLAVVCIFTACDMIPGNEPKDDVIEVIDGYVVVNGVKTDIKADDGTCNHKPNLDVIEVADGYLVVNGVKTEHKVYTEPVLSVIDGYVAVNGVKTEYKVSTDCEHAWETVTTDPTCTQEGYDTMTCPLCDKVVRTNKTEKLDHDYATTYTIDNDYHWYKCNGCNAVDGKELHNLDDEGVCTVCGIPLTETPGVVYDVSADGTYAEVIGYEGTATKVKIASEYKGLPVKNIYDKAFYNNDNVTYVVIPDSVTSIGGYAFYACNSLTSVTIGNSVTSIGDYAFSNCNSALYTEYEYGKYVCTNDNPHSILIDLTNSNFSTYKIHEDTKIIGGRAFSSCQRLTSITIPDSVTSIGDRAFQSCSSLTSITIPDSVTSIGDWAFQSCSSLTSINYDGTIEEWNAIGKEVSWNSNTSTYVIYCTDGEITKDGAVTYY